MANIQPVHSPCYCINYRRAANTLTKYYDAAFAPGASRRSSAIQLSETGRNAFTSGLGIWQKLQEEVQQVLGEGNLSTQWDLFHRIEALEHQTP